MNLRELLRAAIISAGGVAPLARALQWHAGAIDRAGKEGLSPYRAGQLADAQGADEIEAVLNALADGARTDPERTYWSELLSKYTSPAPAGDRAAASIVDCREIVNSVIGPQYEFVVASALDRWLHSHRHAPTPASHRDLENAAKRAKLLVDQHPFVFGPAAQIPISARREMVARFLAGDDSIFELIEQFERLKANGARKAKISVE